VYFHAAVMTWTLGSTPLGRRQRTGILGIKSSVWQCSARSSPLRSMTSKVNGKQKFSPTVDLKPLKILKPKIGWI